MVKNWKVISSKAWAMKYAEENADPLTAETLWAVSVGPNEDQ